MSKQFGRIRARLWFKGRLEPEVCDVMNPGEWFGKVHVVQIAIANALNPFYVIEAGNESDAIDTWADHEQYSKLIDVTDPADIAEADAKDAAGEDTDYSRQGNDGHWVDLTNVGFAKVEKVEYFVEIPDLTDWSFVGALETFLEEYRKNNE